MWRIKSTFSNVNSCTTNQNYLAFVMNKDEIQIFNLKTQKKILSKKGIFESGDLHFINQFLVWCDDDKESIAIRLDDEEINKINGIFSFLKEDLNGKKSGFFTKVRTPERKYVLAKYEENDNRFLKVWSKEIHVTGLLSCSNEGSLFLITRQRGELIVLNSNTGKEIWRKLFPIKEKEKFTHIYGIRDDKILVWKKPNSIVAINIDTGNQEWNIDNIPKPDGWHDDANISSSNFKLSNNNDFLIGIKGRHQWIVDIEKGIALPPINYSQVFNEHDIFKQSSAFFTLDGDFIIFFDDYKRKMISLNWKTAKIESITSFPIEGKESFCGWQGPIVEGDNCFLLDTFGTLYIFERTKQEKTT